MSTFKYDRAFDLRLQRTFYVVGFKFGQKEYDALYKFQGKGCAICNKPSNGTRLSVDHCHSTGLLRGLLCMRCNRAYGLFHDNSSQRLRRAADYLENPPFVRLFGIWRTAIGRIGTKKRAKLLEKMKRENGQ